MKKIIIALGLLAIAVSTYKAYFESTSIVLEQDIAAFLEAQPLRIYQSPIDTQIAFWQQKLEEEPQSGLYKVKLAGLLSEKATSTRQWQFLTSANQLLQEAVQGSMLKKAGAYYQLSQNAIMQHDFQAALGYMKSAEATGDYPVEQELLMYDVLMEVGNSNEAAKHLYAYPEKTSFEYQLRDAKWQDHVGKLPKSIAIMENLLKDAAANNRTAQWMWVATNLGDMYGHEGLVHKSYETYLEVLNKDAKQYHALKGIAWIAFSKDHNLPLSRKIIHYLNEVQPSPEYALLLSELAAYEGDTKSQKEWEDAFIEEAIQPIYGKSYHSHIAQLLLDRQEYEGRLYALIQSELSNRPTPNSYLLHAQWLASQGETKAAADLIDKQIIGKSYEPSIVWGLAKWFVSQNQTDFARKYLAEAEEASFELGPNVAKEIQALKKSF